MGEAAWESRGIRLQSGLTAPCSVHRFLGFARGRNGTEKCSVSVCSVNR